jgi:hypothetical protein
VAEENVNPQWKPVEPMRKWHGIHRRRKVVSDEGKTHNVPALPFEHWCKPSGSVHNLVVMTTRNTKDAVNPHAYGDVARRKALRDKWFPWSWGDARKYAPHLTAGMTTEAEWLKWRAAEQERRMALHNERGAEYDRRLNAATEARRLDTKEAFTEVLKEFSDAMRADRKKGQ